MCEKVCVIWTAAIWVVSIWAGSACAGSAAADTGRAIFRCELNGVPTFSDRPCASAAERYEPDPTATNTYEPPPAQPPTVRAAAKPRQRKPASTPAVDSNKHKEKCERLAERLKDTRAKLRAGYKASEGERIKERQARLKSQLRLARCS